MQKRIYCLCNNVQIHYVMVFILEKEDGSFNHPVALTHPLHPIRSRSRISAETCGLDDVFPPDDLGSDPYTPFIIYIPYIIAAL